MPEGPNTYTPTNASWLPITLAPEVPAGDPPWTARDELAKAAMAAIISKHPRMKASGTTPSEVHERAALGALLYADAYLAARKAYP